MQVLQQKVFGIEDDNKKDALLGILSDKYCRAIMEAIKDKPKSAIEITSEAKIPISTTYRRIQMLHDNKLLFTSGAINEEGKKLFLYKSKIKGIQCNYDEGKVEIKLILNK
jgi:hypothetical protein